MTTRAAFTDSSHSSIDVASSWRRKGSPTTAEVQTEPDMFEFTSTSVQTGIRTEATQVEVSSKLAGRALVDILSRIKKSTPAEEWGRRILEGRVTVDHEVVSDTTFPVLEDALIEFIDTTKHANVGTAIEERRPIDIDEEVGRGLLQFLKRAEALMGAELSEVASSRAFDGFFSSVQPSTARVELWNSLSVDLEKHKVIFPDWTRGAFHPGVVVMSSLTRNKEKVYDIEYNDSGVHDRVNGVRGEYIHVISEDNVRTLASLAGKAAPQLKRGIRVHVKPPPDRKSGASRKYLPGRVVEVLKGGAYDIECGDKVLSGVTAQDIVLTLEPGYNVEARQPFRYELQSTGISWSSSGGSLAVSYGRNDITGWCDLPGAVCVWGIFEKGFKPDEPQFVFDHVSCIMCVRFHPLIPSIVVGGSFNGEVIVWNLNTPEKAVAASSIDSVFSHKEPVMDISWVFDPSLRRYLAVSVSADGRMLFWDLENNLRAPVRGVLLSREKEKRSQYPLAHGGTCLSFSSSQSATRSDWVLVGHEGGDISRGQMSKILSGEHEVNEAAVQRNIAGEEGYKSMRLEKDTLRFAPHVGAVQSIDSSPFHRHLFLSGGCDGAVKLFSIFNAKPIYEWEPSPPAGSTGASRRVYSEITAVRFSPLSPVVFAVSSSDGFLYIYNLSVSTVSPVATVSVPLLTTKGRSETGARPAITGISFNLKQRDMIGACDAAGRSHVWKLDWSLCSTRPSDETLLASLGSYLGQDAI